MIDRRELEKFWTSLDAHMPTFGPEEQTAAVTLYRELARGEPISVGRFAEALGVPEGRARGLLRRPALESFAHADAEGRLVGFGGLAVVSTSHRLELEGRTLWTWCAWDGLFVPEILDEPAVLVSVDPETGGEVRIDVGRDGIRGSEPATAVLSFVQPDARVYGGSVENVMTRFCHFVYLFESERSGEAWVAEHDGTFLCTLEGAQTLARRLNRRNLGDALTGAAAGA